MERRNRTRSSNMLVFWMLSLLITSHFSDAAVGLKSRKLVLSRKSLDNSSFIVAFCSRSGEPTARECEVKREEIKADNKVEIQTCTLKLKTERSDTVVGSEFEVLPFNSDRAIFLWTEKDPKQEEAKSNATLIKISIVDFKNCNNVKETEIVAESVTEALRIKLDLAVTFIATAIVVYRDSFDVVYKNSSLCGDKYCKLTVDLEGNTVDGPVSWFEPVRDPTERLNLVPLQSSSKDLLAIEYIGHYGLLHAIVTLIKDDGPRHLQNVSTASHLDYSTSYETIGLCSQIEKTQDISCSQYDLNGNIKLSPTTLNFGYEVSRGSMHNLKDGGFIIATVNDCWHKRKTPEIRVDLTKIDREGRVVKSVEIKGFECKAWYLIPHIFENSSAQYCIAAVYREFSSYEHLIKCFNNKTLE